MKLVIMGVLLLAAPLFSQSAPLPVPDAPSMADPSVHEGELQWFQLNEDRAQVRAMLGSPSVTAPFDGFESWQFQIGLEDHHEFSHHLIFRQETGELISVTRSYENPRSVAEWFPPAETTVHHVSSGGSGEYTILARKLSGDRVLLAMGISDASQPTQQILLIQRAELRFFYPWLLDQLDQQDAKQTARAN